MYIWNNLVLQEKNWNKWKRLKPLPYDVIGQILSCTGWKTTPKGIWYPIGYKIVYSLDQPNSWYIRCGLNSSVWMIETNWLQSTLTNFLNWASYIALYCLILYVYLLWKDSKWSKFIVATKPLPLHKIFIIFNFNCHNWL